MPTIKTNLLRWEIKCLYFSYEIELTDCQPEPSNLQEIQQYFYEMEPTLIFNFPYLYSVAELHINKLAIPISNGAIARLHFLTVLSAQDAQSILPHIAIKIMKNLQLLFSQEMSACFNPFEEEKKEKEAIIPGFSLQAINDPFLALSIIPKDLVIAAEGEIHDEYPMLLNYDTGQFYSKQNIVRINKHQNQVHFRNGKIVRKEALRSVKPIDLNGYALAHRIHNALDRIKQLTQFLSVWGIKFDSRLVDIPYNHTLPGTVSFRNNQEKSLADLINPMSLHNYNYQYINYFSSVAFDDQLQCEINFISAQSQKQSIGKLTMTIQAISNQMQNHIACVENFYTNFEEPQPILNFIKMQGNVDTTPKIYVFVLDSKSNKIEKDNLNKFVQAAIDQQIVFHLLQWKPEKAYFSYEICSYGLISTLYTKLKLNPWKIKNVPFGHNPIVAVSLHVSCNDNSFSVSAVSTMNVYLTKFTAVHNSTSSPLLIQTIVHSLKECLEKFTSAHNKIPVRMFVFRTGHGLADFKPVEAEAVRKQLLLAFNTQVTYITLDKCSHNLRAFNQLDVNLVTADSVKKVPLLVYIELQNLLYMQLEVQGPMHKLKIFDVQKQDPNFMIKILELLTKLVFGGVGNSYGSGLGFISYAAKLASFDTYNLEKWKPMLRDGVLVFL